MSNKAPACDWTYNDHLDAWDTSCGETFQVFEGTPAENRMRFCAYCGKRLREKRTREAA